jgi:hypothetical protein
MPPVAVFADELLHNLSCVSLDTDGTLFTNARYRG